MALVTYVAKRSLAHGHVVDESYSLRLTLTPSSERSKKDLKSTSKSLSGSSETLYFGQEEYWSIQLIPVDKHEAALIREFLDSTGDGQVFSFDPYGTEATTTVYAGEFIRDDDGYTESRAVAIGTGGEADYIQFAFKVRSV